MDLEDKAMDLVDIIDKLCADVDAEAEGAAQFRDKSNLIMSYYCEGVCDGMHRAMRYIEMLRDQQAAECMKKAAMPASTAADPLEEGDSY